MIRDSLSFHNVAELRSVDGRDGRRLQRVPEDVRAALNEDARERVIRPSGTEIRFVPEGESVEVTLSAPEGSAEVVPFYGPFQGDEVLTVGPEPTTLSIDPPAELGAVDDGDVRGQFSPRVRRLCAQHESASPLYYHGVEGAVRPPEPDEVPATRYLAYGTSITEGFSATRDHLAYPAQAARRLGYDLLNHGSAGSAHCEPELADYMATLEWDVATLSVSVNMLGEFSAAEFRERAAHMVEAMAGSDPDREVVCITLFPFFADFDPERFEDPDRPDDAETDPEVFREILREVVAESPRENVRLLEGPDLLGDVGGHSADVVHPGDHGMIEIGENLARALEAGASDAPDGS